MARSSDRPKSPNSTSITNPVMTPVRPSKRHSGQMKAAKPDLGSEHDAPKADCVVCGGEVIDSQESKETETRHSMKKTGYHCSKCGIAYAFLPPKIKKR